MIVFPYDGDAYLFVQYNGDNLDAVSSLPSEVIQPSTKYFCYFNQGQNAGLVDGVTLTGQTSGAVVVVKCVYLTGGALLSNTGAGILFYTRISGNVISGENLRVGTTTYCVASSGQLDTPYGRIARAIFISVESNDARFTFSGVSPTNTAGTPANLGHLIQPNENVVISGWKNVKDFKLISAVSTSNAVVNMTIHY